MDDDACPVDLDVPVGVDRGAGPIGLGALLSLKAKGVAHVVVDILAGRLETVFAAVKNRAVLTIPAVHRAPVQVDLGQLLMTEIDVRMSMGYPTEIFEVTDAIIANPEKYAQIISHTVPFDDALDALRLAATPGAADKVVVTFEPPGTTTDGAGR